MTKERPSIRSDIGGTSAIEFVLVAPLLVLAMMGVLRFGILFLANAGMQHALGEGAHYASIYPAPTDSQIIDKVESSHFGLHSDDIVSLTVTRGTTSGVNYAELKMRYSVPMDFVLFDAPTVILEHTRRAYTP